MTDQVALDQPDSVAVLWKRWAAALDDLRRRGVIRSTGRPVQDYSESLAFRALDGTRRARGQGYDFDGADGLRYEVKGLRPGQVDNPRRLANVTMTRPLPFDYLVAVFLSPDMEVFRASKIPAEVVERYARSKGVRLTDELFAEPGTEDVTNQLRAIQAEEDGYPAAEAEGGGAGRPAL